MKVTTDTGPVKMKVTGDPRARLRSSSTVEIRKVDATPYTGSYEVTPSDQEQVLQTNGLLMDGNVIINPIPSNYGLITWDGNTLSVS